MQHHVNNDSMEYSSAGWSFLPIMSLESVRIKYIYSVASLLQSTTVHELFWP